MITILIVGIASLWVAVIWLIVWIAYLHAEVDRMKYGKNAFGQIIKSRFLGDE